MAGYINNMEYVETKRQTQPEPQLIGYGSFPKFLIYPNFYWKFSSRPEGNRIQATAHL